MPDPADNTPTVDVSASKERIRGLVNTVIDTNGLCLQALLSEDGFQADGPRITGHPGSGTYVAATVRGYRISFHAPDAHHGLGIVDLPADTTYGVVTQVALALHRQAATNSAAPVPDTLTEGEAVCDSCGDHSDSEPGLPCGRMLGPAGHDDDHPDATVCTGTYRRPASPTQPLPAWLTPGQRATIEQFQAYNVPAEWFVNPPDPQGRVSVLAVGGDPNSGFVWSLVIETDGDFASSEATRGPWETGITI